MTLEKLKKLIDATAELVKQVLEEILPLKKNGDNDDKK